MLLDFYNKTIPSSYRDFSVKGALSREIFVWEIWKRRDPLLTLNALLAVVHPNQAWFWPIEGKAAAPKNSFQVGNFTERGNEQITPPRGKKIVWNVKI